MAGTLFEYPWPGNIRELKNALERACVLSDGRTLAPEAMFENPPAQSSGDENDIASLGDHLAECERRYILRALDAHQWRMQPCADALGISRKTLWEKMRKLGIEKA